MRKKTTADPVTVQTGRGPETEPEQTPETEAQEDARGTTFPTHPSRSVTVLEGNRVLYTGTGVLSVKIEKQE